MKQLLKNSRKKFAVPFYRQYLGCWSWFINKFNKAIRVLLCVIDIFNKYTWVIPLRDKRKVPKNVKRIWLQIKKLWVDNFIADQWNHG